MAEPDGREPLRARRGRRRILNAPRRRARRTVAALVVLGFALTTPILAPVAVPDGAAVAAYNPDDYPSWDEVAQAKSDTAAAEAKVAEIIGLIAQLEDQVAAARQFAEQKMNEYVVAQDAYEEAVRRADALQAQADEAAAKADEAERNAGQVAAQLYRTGGNDLGVEAIVAEAGDDAEELLGKLGSMDKMIERTSGIYARAAEQRNTAGSLAGQADVAAGEREKLKAAAEQAWNDAVAAQQAAEEALAASEAQKVTLDAQVAFLRDAEAKTTAAYEEGERKRIEEEERKRREEEERRRQAAEAAAAGGGGGPGAPSSSGWVKPMDGWLNDGYGPRPIICSNGCSSSFHSGQDIVGGSGSTIYAAYSGRVTIAYPLSTWGNYVRIDHGGGVWTAYAHLSEIWVGTGQWVEAGQALGVQGQTGAADGDHLHFEVWVGGGRIEPLGFMADRGVYW